MSDLPATAGDLRPAPHTSRHIEVNGVRLHYLDYGGEGKRPLVCLHGGGAHAHWFDFVAGAFTSQFHVMSLDNRGHGDSAWAEPPVYDYTDYASDLNGFAEKLDLRDFVLMGHSMGGAISHTYAATYPGRLAALILLDSRLNMDPERLAELSQYGKHAGKGHDTLQGYIDRFRLRPVRTEATPEMVRYVGARAARQFEDGLWRHKIDRRVMSLRNPTDGIVNLSKVKVPVLLVKASLSDRITPEILASVRAGCPQVEYGEVPHSNHHVSLDNPAGTVAVVKPFLARHFG